MSHSVEDLQAMRVTELRDVAKELGEHEALQGYKSMRKDDLIDAISAAQAEIAPTGAAEPATEVKKSAPAARKAKPAHSRKAGSAPKGGGRKLGIRRISTKGLDRAAVKKLIADLKQQRAETVGSGDRHKLKTIRRQLHHLKRRMRAASR